MKLIKEVNIETVTDHLESLDTGVPVWHPEECHAWLVELDDSDTAKIAIWPSKGFPSDIPPRRLHNLQQCALSNPRIASFCNGNPETNLPPVDLRTSEGLEPVIITDDLSSEILMVIDGTHRLSAQYLSGKGIQGVKAYVCVDRNISNSKHFPKLSG
ncbi:DUF1364 domain-containing protein [Planctomicrobium sp.]|nr:hypothetical protein [Planctomicrobium sp.]MDB4439372.1 DUF1364 domain-containing protein [Planctomicrobium sp.]MDB4743373.1 DUF1364 domain-containing protein [Planctomicrobium sp.]